MSDDGYKRVELSKRPYQRPIRGGFVVEMPIDTVGEHVIDWMLIGQMAHSGPKWWRYRIACLVARILRRELPDSGIIVASGKLDGVALPPTGTPIELKLSELK